MGAQLQRRPGRRLGDRRVTTKRVPASLIAGIAAVVILAGGGVGVGVSVVSHNNEVVAMQKHEYVQAVAGDKTTSMAVKIAMVMGSYYESSYKHIGTPYVDRLGKGQPLTVCNGITGPRVVAGRHYSPAECYALERDVYVPNERFLAADTGRATWEHLTPLQQASFIDFVHNKGQQAWRASTMRRLLMAGYVEQACRQNERWKYGTINGVSTVLPGLEVRANANSDLCAKGVL